jgi:hypothetical protein
MYNPDMKVDILATLPRRDPGDFCCEWKLSMRTEDYPEYVPRSPYRSAASLHKGRRFRFRVEPGPDQESVDEGRPVLGRLTIEATFTLSPSGG